MGTRFATTITLGQIYVRSKETTYLQMSRALYNTFFVWLMQTSL